MGHRFLHNFANKFSCKSQRKNNGKRPGTNFALIQERHDPTTTILLRRGDYDILSEPPDRVPNCANPLSNHPKLPERIQICYVATILFFVGEVCLCTGASSANGQKPGSGKQVKACISNSLHVYLWQKATRQSRIHSVIAETTCLRNPHRASGRNNGGGTVDDTVTTHGSDWFLIDHYGAVMRLEIMGGY